MKDNHLQTLKAIRTVRKALRRDYISDGCGCEENADDKWLFCPSCHAVLLDQMLCMFEHEYAYGERAEEDTAMSDTEMVERVDAALGETE